MPSIQKLALVAAFMGNAQAALSDEASIQKQVKQEDKIPLVVLYDPSTHSYFASIENVEMGQGNGIYVEGLYDHDVGILCQWEVVEKNKNVQARNIQCREADSLPPAWSIKAFFTASIDNYLSVEADLPRQDAKAPYVITERAIARNNLGYMALTTKTWDLKEDKVCVKIQKGYVSSIDDAAQINLGCYNTQGNKYLEDLTAYLGMTPA